MTLNELLADLGKRGVYLWADRERLHFSAPDADVIDDALRNAIRVHRAELLVLFSATQPIASSPPIVMAPKGVDIRCTHAQERFLFSAELDGSSNPYLLCAAFRITGMLDVAALKLSIRDIVRRHDVLRSRFEARDGCFVIVPTEWGPTLEIADFSGSEADLRSVIGQEQQVEFDLMHGPHLAVKLYRLSTDRHVLLVYMHHVVSDGGSIAIFARELQMIYAWHTGLVLAPPPVPDLQFRDVAYSEHAVVSEHMSQLLAFWEQDLKTAPAVLALPTDRPRPAIRSSNGSSISLDLDAAVLLRLDKVRKTLRLSDFQIITSAFWLLLNKYSGQWSIVIGTPWRNRERRESENVIGPLLNLLPLHIRLSPNATTHELLVEVKHRTLAAISHGIAPFEQIVSHIRPERSTAYSPIFQVMCAVETTPQDVVQLAGLTIEAIELPNEAARYDLAIVLQRASGALRGAMKYNRALFDHVTAQRMACHFVSALKLVLDDSAMPIAHTQLMGTAEKDLMLLAWNQTDRSFPLDRTLVDFFHDRVAASPDRVAVEHEEGSLSYRKLDHWSDVVANRLLSAGVTTDDIVGITLDRSLELVVAILGVLKSGAAYLPIGSQHPLERRIWMLENAGVKAVIGPSVNSAQQINVGSCPDRPETLGNSEHRSRPGSACYVIYTSGSTGLPKGVVVDHRAIANNLLWMNDEWPLNENDVVLFKSSPGFDVSVKEIFWPLIAGARLVVAPSGASGDPAQLCRIIRNSHISVVHMVPTMLDFFLRDESVSHIAHLRIVMCGGEALSPALRDRFHKVFDSALLHMYGPTEGAIAVTGYEIPADHSEVERLPLGRPMPNCRIYIVDSFLVPVPIGVPGELCIAGVPLARGYISRPDLTAEKFIPDPFSCAPGARMYLTGDQARWRPDGQIEFLGRIDRQIKLGGLRIEPGEIEEVIRAQDGVDDALVVVRDDGGNCTMVAYVASRSIDVSADTIQRGIRTRLPAYMIPASFILMPVFPVNVNGKIDLAALTNSNMMPNRVSDNPPHGELEVNLAQIWCQVLNIETVDRDEDFFDLGGHSLLILQVQAKLRDNLGISVSVANLFLHPTVASIVAHISESNFGRAKRWLKQIIGHGKDFAS